MLVHSGVEVEEEQVLQGDDLALHVVDLGDVREPAGAVLQPGLVHDQVDGRCHLLTDRALRQFHARHQHHRLQPRQRVARGVGVHCRDGTVVAGIHGLQHVQRGTVADLPDDDPVRAHPQRVTYQLPDRDPASVLQVRRPRFHPEHMILAQLQFGGVLDGDDPFVGGHERRQHVQAGRLARTGAAADHDVQPAAHARPQQVGYRGSHGAEGDEITHGEGIGGELPDRQQRAVNRDRRHDRVDPAAVRQPRIHHGAGLVHPAAHPGHDLLDGAAQMALVGEGCLHGVQAAGPLDVDLVVTVDHDLGDFGVPQVGLQRAVPENFVRDLLSDPRPVGHRQRALVVLQHHLQRLRHPLLQFPLVKVRVVEPWPECLQERLVDAALDRGKRVGVPGGAAGHGRLLKRGCCRRPLGQPVGQAHADRLLRRDRDSSPAEDATGTASTRCRANPMMAWLTGCPALDSVIGVPELIETGTARLDGT